MRLSADTEVPEVSPFPVRTIDILGLRATRLTLPRNTKQGSPPTATTVLAFLAIYVIWGSTYLAIRFAVESMPPFLMAGVRFSVAGMALYAFGHVRGAARLGRQDRRIAWVSGTLMLLGGNGAVVWAEQWVPSGVTALLVAAVPLWMVLLDWAMGNGRPGGLVNLGLLVGFGGVVVLMGAPEMGGEGRLEGGLVILFGTVAWAVGSLYVRGWSKAADRTMAAATQMIGGGTCLLVVSLLIGEFGHVRLEDVTTKSWLSLAYLIVMGSVVAYSAYLWLIRETTIARVSTYAYVNPVVAVALGAGFAGERITPVGMGAAVVIVLSVALILTGRARPAPRL